MYFASLDMSDNWNIVVLVVWEKFRKFGVIPHIASLRRSKRIRIIHEVLEWINKCNAWALIALSDTLEKIKRLTIKRYSKGHAWRIILGKIFNIMKEELKSMGLLPLQAVYADLEFRPHTRIIEKIFDTDVYLEKTENIVPADVIAYATNRRLVPNTEKIIIIKV